MSHLKSKLGPAFAGLAALCSLHAFSVRADAATLHVGYSDWPGYVAWQVAVDKGWFKDAGVDVQLEWFDYSASLEAFTAGNLDADLITNTDSLALNGNGTRNTMIMVYDYSNGNDMIVGKHGVESLAALKGKTIGLEIGLPEHLLLLDGLDKLHIPEQDVTIVNAKTNETPQVLSSGAVDAVGAWQPIVGQAMRENPGSQPLFTSAQEPGLIYDVVAVSPTSLSEHRGDWVKFIGVWDRVVSFIADPKTKPEALKIMAARTGVTPETYGRFLDGTKLLTFAEGKATLVDKPGFGSLYGSSRYGDGFNVKVGAYKASLDVKTFIDPSLVEAR